MRTGAFGTLHHSLVPFGFGLVHGDVSPSLQAWTGIETGNRRNGENQKAGKRWASNMPLVGRGSEWEEERHKSVLWIWPNRRWDINTYVRTWEVL